jgi:DNA primase
MTRYDVEKVLQKLGVEHRRIGANFEMHCVTGKHADKSPSLHVRRHGNREGLFFCRACKVGGDLLDLVVMVKGFVDAPGDEFATPAREVARMWLREEVVAQPPPATVMVRRAPAREQGFALPAGVETADVMEWPSPFRDYLLNDRHVTLEQARRWRFGYAVDGKLAMRIVFVVRDEFGRVTSYTGRTILPGIEPRYKNPGEDEHADKAAIFGAEHWPALIEGSGRMRRPGSVYVFEGTLNGLAIERAMPGVALAGLMGSAVHPRHVLALNAFERVVLCTDPDMAGAQAAHRVVASLDRDVHVERVALPAGTDADSLGSRLGAYLRRRKVAGR